MREELDDPEEELTQALRAYREERTPGLNPDFVTPGNAAWVWLSGAPIPTTVRNQILKEGNEQAMRIEAAKNCVHEYARAPRGAARKLPTRACVKCGYVKDIRVRRPRG